MLDPIIIEAKREYAQKVVSNAKSILINARKSATGDLVSSIRYTINSQGKILYIYDEAGKYVRQGRKKHPGRGVNPEGKFVKAIGNWVKAKGIQGRDRTTGRFISNKSLSYLIARGINKSGIPPFDFLSMALRKTRDQLKAIRKAAAKALKKRLTTTK